MIDLILELRSFGIAVQVSDAEADPAEAMQEYGVALTPLAALAPAHAVVVAVAHQAYLDWEPQRYRALLQPQGLVVDVKGICPRAQFAQAGLALWRL